eukprot:7299815-Prymnesium_polylepis.2
MTARVQRLAHRDGVAVCMVGVSSLQGEQQQGMMFVVGSRALCAGRACRVPDVYRLSWAPGAVTICRDRVGCASGAARASQSNALAARPHLLRGVRRPPRRGGVARGRVCRVRCPCVCVTGRRDVARGRGT